MRCPASPLCMQEACRGRCPQQPVTLLCTLHIPAVNLGLFKKTGRPDTSSAMLQGMVCPHVPSVKQTNAFRFAY